MSRRFLCSDERPRQVLTVLGILLGLVGIGTVVAFATRLPGFAGEFFRLLVGIATTPIFLEASFLVLGLVLVLWINHLRRKREGDELVYLDQVEGPDVPSDLPDHARFAVLPGEPAAGIEPSALDRAEGALAIGDTSAASEALAELDEGALQQPDALRLRIRLAEATGHADLARSLRQRLERADVPSP